MKRFSILFFTFLSISLSFADTPSIPELSKKVTDQTSTLSSIQIQRLSQKLDEFEKAKGSQLVVLIVPNTGDYAIEEYAIKVAHDVNKIGREKIDDGLLLLIAKNDRKLRIEVGYGLEGAIPDALAKRIINQIITPQFRAGDFYGGIDHGVDAMIQLVNGEQLPTPNHTSNNKIKGYKDPAFFTIGLFAFPFLLLLAAWLKKKFGKKKGTLIAIAMNAFIGIVIITGAIGILYAIILTIFSLTGLSNNSGGGGYRGGGYYGGGFSGGGFSGGGFSGGGFSGGGGGFGGGGASGGW